MTKVIELTADVKNPQPDRRSKDWYKLPVIPAGMRFTNHGNYLLSSGDRYGHVYTNYPVAKLVIANAKDVAPQSVREFARVHDVDWGGDEILRVLIKLGRVGPDDFAAVAEACSKDENF